jgi:hypothetical protein
MTTKPASIGVALLVIAIGAAIGAASSMRRRPAPVTTPATIA